MKTQLKLEYERIAATLGQVLKIGGTNVSAAQARSVVMDCLADVPRLRGLAVAVVRFLPAMTRLTPGPDVAVAFGRRLHDEEGFDLELSVIAAAGALTALTGVALPLALLIDQARTGKAGKDSDRSGSAALFDARPAQPAAAPGQARPETAHLFSVTPAAESAHSVLSLVAEGWAVVPQLGHFSSVHAVAFSPNGRLALTCSNNTALLWETTTGREIRRLEGHSDSVNAVAFSRDGRLALTGSDDNTARLWEVTTGREIRRLEGHRLSVLAVAFSPDGRLALTASADGTAQQWEVATGREIRRLKDLACWVTAVTFSPLGTLVLIASCDTARVWKVETGREIRCLKGDGGTIRAVVSLPAASRRSPARSTQRRSFGRWRRETKSTTFKDTISKDMAIWFLPWPSPPTVAWRSPARPTLRCGCGMWRADAKSAASKDMAVGSLQ